jgi:hypothetical protein
VVETIQRDLEVLPEESKNFTCIDVRAELPEVLIEDWARIAEHLGWPLGRMFGYLALQGALKISAEAEEASSS